MRRASPYLLAGLLGGSGLLHFVATRSYVRIVPPQLPAPELLVYLSGAAEIACAVGLVVSRTRRAAAWATVGLLLAVFPANVQMALDASHTSTLYRAGTYARLPLQIPLIAWAVVIARSAARDTTPRPGRRRDDPAR